MGQWDVLNLMKKNKGKWFSAKEIAEKANLSIGSVGVSLKKMRENKCYGIKSKSICVAGYHKYPYSFPNRKY